MSGLSRRGHHLPARGGGDHRLPDHGEALRLPPPPVHGAHHGEHHGAAAAHVSFDLASISRENLTIVRQVSDHPPAQSRAARPPGAGGAGHDIRAAVAHHLVRPRVAAILGRGQTLRLLSCRPAADARLLGHGDCPLQRTGDIEHR